MPTADTAFRPANGLSAVGLEQVWDRAVATGRLRQVTVTTGGKEPVLAWASYLSSAGQSQINVSQQYCPIARSEMANVYRQNFPGRLVPAQLKVNIAQVAWRKMHPRADGIDYRRCPINLEISHTAEAYHDHGVFPGLDASEQYRTGYKVELSNMEAAEINESRKLCADMGLMWRLPETGELIPQDEADSYRGSTCCFHASFGVPCYAPYPTAEVAATLITPNKNRGKRSRTGPGPSPIVLFAA